MVETIGLAVIPLIMILIGFLWREHYPKNINWVYGYRSFRSMKNQQTWEFAHRHFAKNSLILGTALVVFNIFIFLFFDAEQLNIWVPIHLAVLFLTILPTEIALRRSFDKNGEFKK
ncbi:SdpI family protein [Alkalicella caledoniensis]|uniref:SdpI family protein n=1 Tax=Alkalicella caledoniensis TaxID=2731377 RepID=A0A7G9W506_ALKCA|nr:SdpI family protein [Alkalicella caledoniensis]QNO13768.1 SdpI family protein [Alkalicella caledoniensis]